MNVPETMNEVLDMSDDEGMKTPFEFIIIKSDYVFVSWEKFIAKKNAFRNIKMCVVVSKICVFNTLTLFT